MGELKRGFVLTAAMWMLIGLLALPSYGQVKSGNPSPGRKAGNEWEFTVAPYAWLAGISGDTTVKDRTVHTSVKFRDLLKDLDFGAQAQIEARKGKWGMFLQPNYLKITPTAGVSRPANMDILQGGPAVREADVRLDSRTLILEFGGFYRVADVSLGPNRQCPVSFDVLAGGRYWYVQNHISLNLPQGGVSFSDTSYGNIIDPIIGLRMASHLTPKFFVTLRGDAGGFGVSSNSSHISWNGVGTVGYDISPCASIVAGYRYLYINYSPSGGAGLKASMQGPLIGFSRKF
ncbi:MAG: hypothetical protein A4E57_01408 [Syntrophorhabdaceae bacterium PtaU1.Bin034]|jgi:hypothetical protein|nr:MAG: hypothetical protein A4E57_01408 [Syntrophorhabdaceae bacterium PtaU1.Bin034]